MSKTKTKFANIAPAMPLPPAGRQVFTYRLPQGQAVGDRQLVQVSVGRRLVSGIIINTHSQKPSYPTKEVKRLYDSALTPHQLAFAKWIAAVTRGSLGYTSRLFFPPSLPAGEPISSPVDTIKTAELQSHPPHLLTAPFEKRLPHLLALLKNNLKANCQTLFLVPEIWMIERLHHWLKTQGKIPSKKLFTYHGGRKTSELTAVWNAIGSSESAVIIGTQKALLLPWQSLTHIVLEEEAYDTHKLWDQYPRLDNRLAVRELARLHQATLTLTNTYPSLATARLHQESLSKKVTNHPLALHPRLTLYSHQDRRSRRLLPNEFLPRLRSWYKDGDQILFLYNRRQEAEVSTKPGWQTDITTVADILKKLRFPATKILWLDAPAAAKKSPATLAKQINNARIIIATSVIFTHINGHKVGRAAWLFPEQTLNYPDYRSVERARITLSRLQQLVPPRRAVDLLSRQPQLIADHLLPGYDAWVTQELKLRRRYHYPPYTDIVRLTAHGNTQKEADAKARKLRQQLQKNIDQQTEGKQKIILRGPYRALPKPRPKAPRESHLLLQGPLEHLANLYNQANPDTTDPYPHQIL